MDKTDYKIENFEQELFELENYINDIWQFLPIPIAYLSPLGVVLDMDKALQELLRYPKEEIIGKIVEEFFPQKEKILQIQKVTLEKGQTKNQECCIKNKENSEIPVSISTLLRKDEKENIIGYFMAFVNVSEQKKAEEKVLESEERYKKLYEYAGNPIFTFDANLKITEVNKLTCELVGLEREKFIGYNIFELGLLHPEDIKKVKEHIKKLLRGEKAVVEKLRFKLKEGDFGIFEVIATPVYKHGKIVAINNICRNITELETLMCALKESEKKYRTLVEQSHDAIYIYRGDKFLFMNNKVSEITGYSKDELYQISVWELIHPNDRGRIREIGFKRARGEEVPSVYEAQIITKKGNIRHCEFAVTAITYQGQYAALGAVRDITKHKQADEELKKSFEKLRITLEKTVYALASAVEMKDPYTAGHQRRVTQLASAIAKELNFTEEQINGIRMASAIHDIGKIYIPSEILSKPSELTEIESNLIKTHPQIGYDIIKEIEFPWPVAQIMLQHHERMDGSGYPKGLSQKDIILEARIVAVADVVEAICFHRPYRPALGIKKALREISLNKGILYDYDAVNVCLRLFNEKKFKFR